MSRYLRIFFFFCISIGLSSCSQYLKSNAKTQSNHSKATHTHKSHRVVKGETLYSIAWYYGYDYRQVALWNEIDYPYLIKPNQTIQLQPSLVWRASNNTEIKHGKRATPSSKQLTQGKTKAAKQPKMSNRQKRAQTQWTKKKKSVKKKTSYRSPKKYPSRIKWLWPTRGKTAYRFSNKSGKKGLGISGKKGQRIVAAAAGRVVYSGSGLRGYGKLIIIKHNDTYLSAYANNKKILVKGQQKVKSGEHIADMGSNSANKNILHFEIRKNGKPVNPINYLPR